MDGAATPHPKLRTVGVLVFDEAGCSMDAARRLTGPASPGCVSSTRRSPCSTTPVSWDEGHVITAAGISAGIDMSLHVVARLHGDDTAAWTARTMEHQRQMTASPLR